MHRLGVFAVFCSLLPLRAMAAPQAAQPPTGAAAASAAPASTVPIGRPLGEPITLPNLLQHAATHVPALAQTRLDVAAAQAGILRAEGRFDWQLGADFNAASTPTFLAGMAGRQTRLAGVLEISRVWASGGTLGLRLDSSDTEQNVGAFAGEQWSNAITATLAQPLLRGRGAAITQAALRRARLDTAQALTAENLAELAAVQSLLAAYWDLTLAHAEREISASSLVLARERLRLTNAGIAAGKVAGNEDLAVLQAIASRNEELLIADLAILTRSIQLRRAAALPLDAPELRLVVPADVATPTLPTKLDSLIAQAYAQSPELARLRLQGQTTALDLEVTRNGLLPRLDLAVSLGPSGQAPSFADAATALATDPYWTIQGSLTYRQALGQREVRGQLAQLQQATARLALGETDIKAQIATTIRVAAAQVELVAARLALSDETIRLARRNIDNEVARTNLGKATNFDVMQRQEELKAAQLRRVRMLIEGQKALATALAASGDLLPYVGFTSAAR